MTITAKELKEKVQAVKNRGVKERETNAINWVNGLTPELITLAESGLRTKFISVPSKIDPTIVKRTFKERGFKVKDNYSGFWIEW